MADTTDAGNPFVETVRDRLTSKGWRVARLAESADINDSQLSRILRREKPASADIVRKVALAFGESQLDWFRLAGYIDDMPGPTGSAEEAEAIALLNQMTESDRETALLMLEALAKRGKKQRAERERKK